MSLFFIQQYIVVKTSHFLTEIQNTVNSSVFTITLTRPNPAPTTKYCSHLANSLVSLSHVMS